MAIGRRVSNRRSLALQLILLLGLVSALGDITYEGARSVSGPYLALLGAGAGAVGLVSGLGEFVGYALRLVAGLWADRTRAYWWFTFAGYGLLVSIPLLALAGRWEVAAALLILERIGKAVRSPARDTIISHASSQTGRGWGFGLHEALDQVGAVIGPLILGATIAFRGSYRAGLGLMWIPALLTVAALAVARIRVPSPEDLEESDRAAAVEAEPAGGLLRVGGLPRVLWVYALFTFLAVGGFASFALISYHLATRAVVPAAQIPLLYAVAMGVDAVVALAVGRLYDRVGIASLVVVPVATAPIPLLALSSSRPLVWAGVVLWGVVMAVHETTMRAAVADFGPVGRRASAYGIFNTVYGAGWLVGGALMGYLYESLPAHVMVFAIAMEVAAVPAFVWARREASAGQRGRDAATRR